MALSPKLETISQLLIDHGAQVNIVSHITAAICNNHWASFQILLKHQADVNARLGEENRTPLFWAIRSAYIDFARELLAHGATAIFEDPLGFDLLNIHNRELLQLLLDHGAHVNATNKRKMTVLMRYAEMEWLEGVQLLVEHGALLELRDQQGKTALDYAIEGDGFDIAHYLLAHGAPGNENEVNLIQAAKNGNSELLKHLLESGQPWSVSTLTKALEKGVICGRTQCVQLLLDAMANPDHPTSEWRALPLLMTALEKEDTDMAWLLIRHGANVNATSMSEQTPLILAIQHNQIEMVQELLVHGADANQPVMHWAEKKKHYPLIYALQSGNSLMVQTLLNYGVNTNPPDTEDDPLVVAIQSHLPLEILIALEKKGASIHKRDSYQRTPLMKAAEQGEREVARWLLERKAKVNDQVLMQAGAVAAPDEIDNHELLAEAAFAEDFEYVPIAQLLIQAGATVPMTAQGGRSAQCQ
ncbi:ankyrin repeat domain-containing protein [Deltaproteobacteria bacterium TL4]